MDADALAAEADRAAAGGDLQRAIDLLEQADSDGAPNLQARLKVAALYRASGKPRQALGAVHKALEIEPLDFTALLLRASLLQRLDDPASGEAWGHALAQRPDGPLPPQLAAATAEGERHHQAWLEGRDAKLQSAAGPIEAVADAEQRARIARFRSNILRQTRHYHSEPTHFHYPGLTEREFHPRRLFPWLEQLEAATQLITGELNAVMSGERGELVPYIQYEDHMPLDQWRALNRNTDWTAIHLLRNGETVAENARHCPRTLALLETIPQPDIAGAGPNAMFSLLAPNTHIPPHVGVNNARLVCHLPLVVPPGCWFRVGAERREWQVGQAFVFDDTIEHEAMNPSDELRVVLIFDVWHPDLSETERQAVSAMVGAENEAAPL